MNSIEGLVRPAIMVIFVAAQVALGVAWAYGLADAKDAFAALGSFTMMVVTFLFKARDEEKRAETGTGNGGTTVSSTGTGATLTVVPGPPATPAPPPPQQ